MAQPLLGRATEEEELATWCSSGRGHNFEMMIKMQQKIVEELWKSCDTKVNWRGERQVQ